MPSPTSSVVHVYTLTSAARDHFEIEVNEAWAITPPCVPEDTIASVGVSRVPAASCNATRALRFDLKRTCAAPCTVRHTYPEPPTCECPK